MHAASTRAPWRAGPVIALAAALAGAVVPAIAQDYPTRPVRLIVPFAPGGSADVFGRFIAQRLQESLGQSFIIDKRPGAGTVIGTDAVAKAAPDGYTPLVMSNTHTVNESLLPNKPYQLMRDFVPVAAMTMGVEEFGRHLQADIAKWAHIVKVSGAKAE
jgi:tripartite-type tricarboxylate transporter receptor subunit TctC